MTARLALARHLRPGDQIGERTVRCVVGPAAGLLTVWFDDGGCWNVEPHKPVVRHRPGAVERKTS